MATNTKNYKLIKPDVDDFYDIEDFNKNADVVDTELKKVDIATIDLGNKKLDKIGDSSDTTVVFTKASSRTAMASGETKKTLFGKIAKWLADLKAVAFTASYKDLNNVPSSFPPESHNHDSLYYQKEEIDVHTKNDTIHITAPERTSWNAKASTTVASTSANGLMSSVDKSKLNGIESEINNATENAIKNLFPGGTQILRNTNADIKEYPTTNAQGLWKDGGWMRSGGGTVETIPITNAPNADIKWGRRVTSINITQDCVYRQRDLSTYPGQEYTFSAYARYISGDNTIKLQHPANGASLRVRFKATENWTRYEVTFTAVGTVVAIEYGMDSTSIGTVEFCGEKLEVGNKATDWSPSPWDVEQLTNNAMENAINNAYPSTLDRIDLTGRTTNIDNLNLAGGSPRIIKYICRTDGGTANITGDLPVKQAFILDVELLRYASTTDYVTRQTLTLYENATIRFRTCRNGVWSNWRNIYDSTGLPPSNAAPRIAGIASAGVENNYSRGDHVHPAQTTISGNAGTATKLQTARMINGVAFDGTNNISLPLATTTGSGLMSAADKTKLNKITNNRTTYSGSLVDCPNNSTATLFQRSLGAGVYLFNCMLASNAVGSTGRITVSIEVGSTVVARWQGDASKEQTIVTIPAQTSQSSAFTVTVKLYQTTGVTRNAQVQGFDAIKLQDA